MACNIAVEKSTQNNQDRTQIIKLNRKITDLNFMSRTCVPLILCFFIV